MNTSKGNIFLNTIFWGFILWLFGYVLGIIFFMFVPKGILGWCIMPFGLVATLWVLFKKIKRDSFTCFIGLGVIWTIMAIVLDYIFLIKFLKATDYYKLDVYIYYLLTFALPIIVGMYRYKKTYFKKR
ncbi:MAG: hypothetical protein NTU97_03515 [Candidatus Magasanikbacteria bacterium]|nr:hypothetical protein [Candidatus Magasanikbacteria bacterium]